MYMAPTIGALLNRFIPKRLVLMWAIKKVVSMAGDWSSGFSNPSTIYWTFFTFICCEIVMFV